MVAERTQHFDFGSIFNLYFSFSLKPLSSEGFCLQAIDELELNFDFEPNLDDEH